MAFYRRTRPQPSRAVPTPTVGNLNTGDQNSADAMLRQIVGSSPTGAPQLPAVQPYQPGMLPTGPALLQPQFSPVQQQAAVQAALGVAQTPPVGMLPTGPALLQPQFSLAQQQAAQQAALGVAQTPQAGIGGMQQQMGIGQLGQPLGPMPMVNPQSSDALKQQFLAQQGIAPQPVPAYQDPRQLGRTMEQAATAMMQPQQPMGQQAPFGRPQQSPPSVLGPGGPGMAQTPLMGQQAPFGGPQQSPPSGLGSGGFGTAQTPAMTQQPQPAQQPTQQPAQQQGMQPSRPFGRLGGASGGRSGLF